MTLKPWVIAALTVLFLGMGGIAGNTFGVIHVTTKPNSCSISCPEAYPHSSEQGGVSCHTKTAPLCQCTDANKPIAACVPLN
jgi:threonine aldolase